MDNINILDIDVPWRTDCWSYSSLTLFYRNHPQFTEMYKKYGRSNLHNESINPLWKILDLFHTQYWKQ